MVAGIAKLIEAQPNSFNYAIHIIVMTYSCGAFLTILNLLLRDKDWFAKRNEAYLKAEKDAETAEMAKYMYEKWHPKD